MATSSQFTPEFVQNQFNLLVQSYEHFTYSTSYPSVLRNTLCDTSQSSKVTNSSLLTSLNASYGASNAGPAAIMKDFSKVFMQDKDSSKTAINSSSTNTHLQQWLFDQGSNPTTYISNYISHPFCQKVVQNFASQFPPIETYYDPVSNSAYPSEYLDNVKSVYFDVFMVLFGQLREEVCGGGTSGGTGGNSCTAFTTSSINSTTIRPYIDQILAHIIANVYQYIAQSDGTIGGYIQTLFTDLMMNYRLQNSTNNLTSIHYNLIFIAFQPFFYYLYILSFIPSPSISGTNKAPRNGIVRGLAILATYKFIMYTLYGTYKLVVKYDPSLGTAVQLRQVIDMNVTTLFNEELQQFNTAINSANTSTQDVTNTISNIQDLNQQITMARSNVANIANNDAVVMKQLKKSAISKWSWLSILIVLLVSCNAAIFVSSKLNEEMKELILQCVGCICVLFIVVVSIFGAVEFSSGS